MSSRMRAIWLYAFAIGTAAIATWLRILMRAYLDDQVPFGFYFLAVIVSAWYAGLGPALVTLILGTLCAAHYFIPPHDSLVINEPHHWLSLGVYVVVGLASILLCESLRRERARTRAAADEVATLNEKLREADRRKDEFLAMLAHELRNPLAPMQSGLEFLQSQLAEGSKPRETTEVMERQLRQMARLVNDLMEVSRFLHGRIELVREDIDVAEFCRVAIETVQPRLERSQHQLIVDLPDRPVWVHGDQVRLAQVVANLLHNAIKYTPHGGRIDLSIEPDGEWVAVRVRDDGIGIDSETLPKVFDLFSQSRHAKQHWEGGLGLGLAIVQQIVLLHGGSVTCRSNGLGQGSEFSLRLPTARPNPKRDAAAPDKKPATISVPIRRRVLIVDDNREAANMLALLLKLQGHEVGLAFDADSAVDAAKNMEPDLAILDIGLPGCDGYELARLLRQHPGLDNMHLVALSGHAMPEDFERSQEVGFEQHFVKPVSITDLQKVLTAK